MSYCNLKNLGSPRVSKLYRVITSKELLSQEHSTCLQYLSLLLLLGTPQGVVALILDPPAAEALHLRNSTACCCVISIFSVCYIIQGINSQ